MILSNELILKFILSSFLGGVVGAEREFRSKSAGFRTMILISLGSCFFTTMSYMISSTTPERIASNIVTGIGFLGAGVIFRGDNRVNGITTAATIWAVSALGMGVGMGQYLASCIACFIIIVVLALLPFFESFLEKFSQSKNISITASEFSEMDLYLKDLAAQHNVYYKVSNFERDRDIVTYDIQVRGSAKRMRDYLKRIIADDKIIKVSY